MKYTKKDIEHKLNSIQDGIIDTYQEYDKYNYMTIHMLLKYSRASVISKLMINNESDKIKDYLRYYSKNDLLDMIIYYLFDDIPYNFLINLKEIMNYMKSNPDYKPHNLDLYKQILEFNSLDIIDIINLFNKYKDLDCRSLFYYDFRIARNIAYHSINQHLLNLDEKITYLNGEDFYLCIHSSNSYVWDNKAKVVSLSLISHDNTSCYDKKHRKFIYGFSKLKIDHIIHLYPADSYSSYTYGTDKIQRVLEPKDLMKETGDHNEIFYKLDPQIKPDLMVCYDVATEEMLQIAKDNNLKVVIINTKHYKQKEGKEKVLINTYITEDKYRELSNYELLDNLKR